MEPFMPAPCCKDAIHFSELYATARCTFTGQVLSLALLEVIGQYFRCTRRTQRQHECKQYREGRDMAYVWLTVCTKEMQSQYQGMVDLRLHDELMLQVVKSCTSEGAGETSDCQLQVQASVETYMLPPPNLAISCIKKTRQEKRLTV